ncbi:hypothetical protein Hanom_Chr12g01134531 [Helianthus anomalus]
MAMGICRYRSLSGGELGREIPSAVRGTVQLPFFSMNISGKSGFRRGRRHLMSDVKSILAGIVLLQPEHLMKLLI